MPSSKRRSSELLLEARAFRAERRMTDDSIFHFLSSIDTPRALTVWLLYRLKEHDQLTSLEIDPIWYQNGYRFRLDYTATSFLSKARFLKTTFKLRDTAFTKFFKFEELCRDTNYRFRNPALDPQNHGSNVWLLNAVKRKISIVLGDFSGDEFADNAGWGPGVSTQIKGEHVSAINKFHAERGITRDLYSLVGDWFPIAYPSWANSLEQQDGGLFSFEVGNVIVTVPKNSKTDRVIAIEPGINLWFQKSVGHMIRRRLLRHKIDLTTQEINQRAARRGSLDSSLATVDFSSASDSIALEVVRELLPPRWFLLLDACRSKYGMLDSGPLKCQKFSSMGNGYTFELESLIFFAAATSVCEYLGLSTDEISVFGDDVIIPNAAFDLFSSFCAFLGFRVNPEKSFSTGYFRESCGSYYFGGVDCKPLFLKEKLSNVESLYKLANRVRLLAHRYGFNRSCDNRFLDLWSTIVLRIPEPLRLRVPLEAGDTGLISNFDEATPARARYGIEGFFYRALAVRGVKAYSETTSVLLARLWYPTGLSDQMYGNTYTLRGRTQRAIVSSLVPRWYNMGPWE